MDNLMYRYDCWHSGGGTDEDGWSSFRESHLSLTVYRVVRRTAKGVWVHEGETTDHIFTDEKERFVLSGARKRLCYETKADALISFMARKKKQMQYLDRDIRDLKRAIALAEHEFQKCKKAVDDDWAT